MKTFKQYLRQQLHENQGSDNPYAKYGMPDNVEVIVNRGNGYDENLKGNHATNYIGFISSRDTDTLAKLALDDYKENGGSTPDGGVRTVTDPTTGRSIQMTYGKDLAGRSMNKSVMIIPKPPATNTPATNTTRNLNGPEDPSHPEGTKFWSYDGGKDHTEHYWDGPTWTEHATDADMKAFSVKNPSKWTGAQTPDGTMHWKKPEDPSHPEGTKFWSYDGNVHTEHATDADMKAFSVKNPSQWTGAQTPDGTMHWKKPGTPHVPGVKGAGVKLKGGGIALGLIGPVIAAGTALLDKKSLADAGRDAAESLVNNLDPFITTTLGDSSIQIYTPAEVEYMDAAWDAANTKREKQAKDEAEKTKQKALNDAKSGNNSLNKTIDDILSVGAKKNK